MENKQQKYYTNASLLSRFSAWVVTGLKGGIFGRFFTSYDATNERFKKKTKALKRKGGSQKRTKRTIARAIEKNPVVKVVPKLHHFLLTVAVRDYGIILLTMAVASGALFYVQDYVPILSWSISSLITAIVLGVFAIPMLFSKRSLAHSLFEGKLFNSLLFGFFGMSDEIYRYTADDKIRSSPSIALLCGMILSVIAYFPGLLGMLIIVCLIALAYHVLITPEVGIIVMILSLPFSSISIMVWLTMFVSACYIFKCIAGRRTFKLEFADLWMLIISLTVAYGGFVSYDIRSSTVRAVLVLALLSAFFVLSNLVRSKEWYRRCIISFCISSTTASLIGITQYILGRFEIVWDKMKAFATVHERATSTFADPDSFALYIVASLSFLLLFIFSGRSAKSRTVGVICGLVNIGALVLTFSKVGLIGFAAMLIFMLLIFNRNSAYIILFFAGAVFALNYALPNELLDTLFALFRTTESAHDFRLYSFTSAIAMIAEKPFGIGLGSNAFSAAFGQIVGTSPALSSSGNIYLQFALGTGILGLILLISTVIVMLRLVLSYCAITTNRFRRINAIAGFVGVFGIFWAGFYSYCFAEPTIIALVAICLALSYAYIKIDSEVYDALEVNHANDILTASIDIELDKDAVQEYVPTRKYVHSPRLKSKKGAGKSALDNIKSNEIDPIIDND